MTKKKICLGAAFLVVIISVVLIWYFCADFTFETTQMSSYKSTGKIIEQYSKYVMPELNTLLVYEDIEYRLKSDDLHTHQKYVEYLNVIYDSDTYLLAKRSVNLNYKFLDTVVTDSSGNYLIPQYSFRIDEYKFKVVAIKDGELSQYPKYFGMIATNDALCSITYLYFYNEELDKIKCGTNISDTMAEFVIDNFDINFNKNEKSSKF